MCFYTVVFFACLIIRLIEFDALLGFAVVFGDGFACLVFFLG